MFLSGGLRQTRLWTTTLPQLSLEEPTLRYAAMAIGALRKAYAVEGLPIGSVLSDTNKDYLNAVIYYCEALRLQSQASPTHEGLRTAMLSSLLFICFETLRSNMPVALKHITHGFSMLNELAACTENAPSLVSIAPAPPSLVQELLDCYRPLEQQSRSFMGSYRRAFFSQEAGMPGQPDRNSNSRPHQHSPPAQLGSGNPSHTSYDPREYSSTPVSDFSPPGSSSSPTATGASSKPANSSPPSIPGSPWGIRETTTPPVQEPRSIQDDLPSPQSQTSPRSQGSQTPFRPQRPPGIMPFTKHSPYFRPKISNITSLETLPAVFASLEEAQGYWSLLQKQMVQNVPLLMSATSQLNLSKMTDDTELERRLASVKKDPKISAFVAESRKWLHRWIEAFDPLFEAKMRDRIRDMQRYLEAANLRIEYLILEIYTSMTRFSDVQVANGLTPQYRELNTLAEALLQARPNCGFAMDAGVTWPLFVSAYSCRDPSVRADAMRILEQYPIRNALRDSRVFRAIALRNDEAERESAEWGDGEQAHWLRLRRREMVFEDFGRSVIFRSVRLNAENQWTLIEEAADFTIQKDGSLLWKQQPISESMSILSGVC